jgi:peptidoglycan/xylan/chitin deacetylase (PgdA/CDA1 family)
LEKVSGSRPWGWLTPGFSVSENTFDLLKAAGIRYTTDWVNDDQPYWFPTAAGPLLGIPYTLEANDISLCLSARLSAEDFAQALIDQFDQLWQDGERSPRIMAIGLHPFIVGQPLRMGSLKKALQHIQSRPQTWLTTGDGLYDWYAQACPAPETP